MHSRDNPVTIVQEMTYAFIQECQAKLTVIWTINCIKCMTKSAFYVFSYIQVNVIRMNGYDNNFIIDTGCVKY